MLVRAKIGKRGLSCSATTRKQTSRRTGTLSTRPCAGPTAIRMLEALLNELGLLTTNLNEYTGEFLCVRLEFQLN